MFEFRHRMKYSMTLFLSSVLKIKWRFLQLQIFCNRKNVSGYKINEYFYIIKGHNVRIKPCNHIIEEVYNQFFDFLCRQFA